ncbi:MAG: DNA polymerase III subunit delta [Oscillospiraceae bacterium]
MGLYTEPQLLKEVKSGKIESLYYFFGKDTAALEGFAAKLVDKLVTKDARDLNLHRIAGKNLDFEALSDGCTAYPMFAERVAVTVNDLDADSLGKQDFELLLGLLGELSETTTVIFYATGVDLYKGKRFLSDKNKKLCDFCAKHGAACEFPYQSAAELSKRIIASAEKRGCTIGKPAALYLAEKCLCSQALIKNEIEKLTAYADGGEITKATVDLLVTGQLEADAFRLAAAIIRGNAQAAFDILENLLDLRNEPIAILAAAATGFADLYRARAASSAGMSEQAVLTDFSYPKNRAFAVSNALRDCRNISTQRIRACMTTLAKADLDMKSARAPSRLVLEQAVAEMLR